MTPSPQKAVPAAFLVGVLLLSSLAFAEEKDWQYGGFVDLSYALNFNLPDNHRWRSKETTPRTNELAPNMGLAYLHKDASVHSRWGMELAVQGGYDTNALVPEPREGRDQPIGGADALRHVSRANVQYLAPVGRGLLLTAGLMQGYINYESFYAKRNFNYTRAYVTDYSPNFMMGVGARYSVTPNVDVGVHVINGFEHLSHPNNAPSYGFEMDWRLSKRTTFAQNIYLGPDQDNTAVRYWRFFSDTNLQWKNEFLTLVLIYDIGTEEAAEQAGHPRTFWTGGAVLTRWDVGGPWSIGVRPEFFWDRNARLTDSEQLLLAVTSTLQYTKHAGPHEWIVRLEHRYDQSTGQEGGFFRRTRIETGPGLAREQHLLLMSLIWAFDS